MAETMDFIGFTYNGKHSFNDFGVYRAIDGDRYNDDLVPQMTDKTAEVPGGDGIYYFSTTYKNRVFNISIAFDSLTEVKYREMRRWLEGKAIHDLIFDETPYKVYSAKVTGTPQLKTICFDGDNGQRIYKGEGTIQFTCYYPFAHTPNFADGTKPLKTLILKAGESLTVPCGLVMQSDLKNLTNCSITYKLHRIATGTSTIAYTTSAGQSGGYANGPYVIDFITFTSNATDDIEIQGKLLLDSTKYYAYTERDCFEETTSAWESIAYRDGRNFNHYPASEYPNKLQWCAASQLYLNQNTNNYGDIPAPFIVTKDSVDKDTKFIVGDCEITVKEACTNFKWDSKTGLVTELVSGESKERPINYTGTSYGTIPIGPFTKNLPAGATLEYNYWYY